MPRRQTLSVLAAGLLAALIASPVLAQCVSLTTPGSAYTQSFNTLSSTAGSTTNNLTITGWFLTESGGGARDNEQYGVDTGGSNTGDIYSYGAAGNAERALGALRSGTLVPLFGACFTNNTGATLTSLDVAYTGEQWRLGTVSRTDQINFQYSTNATDLATGTWTPVAALNFTTPDTATTGARDGNAAATRTALASTIPALGIANGATFWIRSTDTDASGADDGLAVDDFSLTPQGGVVLPALNIGNVTLAEGDPPGTTTFTFAVTLTAPAGPGGVTFDIATADNTATTADNDYVAQSLTGQSIPMGSTGPYNFSVTVNRDTTAEANQTFFVNVSSIVGANAGNTQGLGTINNDDVVVTPIHDIQGPGASSPIIGASVTTRGIVTGVKSNGFFLQEPDALVDADPQTSEGVLVFTSSAPPAAAGVGNLVQVTGTVTEFVPTQDPLQPPLTELTSPTVVLISSGHPLPAAVPLGAVFPDPAGPFDQLERLEGMRVSVASLTVTGPTLGSLSEANATSTSTGVFYGVVTGVPRPFREAGIQAPDPAPSGGAIPPIPRFDANPERIRVDSDGLVGGPLVDVGAGAAVTGLVGPLDYTFRTYTVLPDPGSSLGVSGGPVATQATAPTGREFTVASYNLQRFYDTADAPGTSDVVLTAAALDRRLAKASLAIRDNLRMPDILGVVEVENLTVLQTLAARISADAVAASQPDPQYVAYLVEGNDIGGIDVGFLVKTAEVAAGVPRVEVVEVQQELAGTLFVNADASTELLNDRPPLRLNAVVHHANGASFPVTVITNHLRSLNSANLETPGSNGWPTTGARVRAKRQEQAELTLANLVQARQIADPAESIILVGDFNAFEVNDGLGHSMGVIAGTPAPDNETAVPGDGADLVDPDLTNLGDTPPAAERYSFIFDGNAQNLDHLLVNAALVGGTVARRIEHPRINADFPDTARNDGTTPARLADHDPVLGFFEVAAFAVANLTIDKVESADPVLPGANLAYTITLDNAGPDPADNLSWSDTLPAGTTFVSLAEPGGWSCSDPGVGNGGAVSCSIASLGVTSAAFTLTVAVAPGTAAGTVLSNTVSAVADTANASDTETTTVAATTDLQVSKVDATDPLAPATVQVYTITVTNAGPDPAEAVELTDILPAGTTFSSLAEPPGWTCTTPAVGSAGTVSCSIATLAVGSEIFSLAVQFDASLTPGATITNEVTVSSETSETGGGDETASAVTTVGEPGAELSLLKTAAPDPVLPGGTLTYTLTVVNAGPGNASTVSLEDGLAAGTTFQSISPPAGWSCPAPAVVEGTTYVTCTTPELAPGNAVFTLVVTVDPSLPAGTSLVNSAVVSSPTPDPEPENQGASATATVGAPPPPPQPAALSATKSVTGQFRPGGAVVYTIVLTNAGPGAQPDNPGDELTDLLPLQLDLAGASATSGTAVATLAANTVTWNGALAAGASVTITIQATIDPGTAPGTTITNQASLAFDSNGDGTNDAAGVSDDPGPQGSGDPTALVVAAAVPVDIPALDVLGVALLTALLAAVGARKLRRVQL